MEATLTADELLSDRENGKDRPVSSRSESAATRPRVRHVRGKKSSYALVEFDRNVVKMIKTDARGENARVTGLGVRYVPSGDEADIQEAVIHLMEENGVAARSESRVLVPRHLVHVKAWRLPSQDPRELEQMVGYRLQKEIPLPPESIVHDFRVVEKTMDGYTRGMIFIARRAEIEKYLRICHQAGLRVTSLHVASDATSQVLRGNLERRADRAPECAAILEVDFSSATVYVIENGVLTATRSAPLGIRALLPSPDGSSRGSDTQRHWTDALAREVEDTITTAGLAPQSSLTDLVVTGWLPQSSQLSECLTQRLGLPVTRFHPEIPGLMEGSQSEGGDWFSTTALVGALRSSTSDLADLRPPENRQAHRHRTLKRRLVHTGLLLVYMAIIVCGVMGILAQRKVAATERIRLKTTALLPQVEARQRWQRRHQALQRQLGEPARTAGLVLPLLKALPSNVELSAISYARGDRMVIRGMGKALADVLNLHQEISADPAFDRVHILSADRRRDDRGEVVEFEIQVNLDGAGSETQR